MVNVDAMFLVEPGVPVAGPAPGSQHFALRVQLEHRRCGNAAVGNRRLDGGADLLRREARRHVNHPQAIAVVHEQSADIAQDPIVRQRRRPRGIDLVDREPVGRWRPRDRLGVRPLRAGHHGQEQNGNQARKGVCMCHNPRIIAHECYHPRFYSKEGGHAQTKRFVASVSVRAGNRVSGALRLCELGQRDLRVSRIGFDGGQANTGGHGTARER